MISKNNRYGLTVLAMVLMCSIPVRADASRVEIISVKNKAALGAEEVDFINEVLITIFAELPKERFEVRSIPHDASSECDDTCQLDLSKQRGTHRTVIASVSPFGDGYVAIIKLYDTENGQLLKSLSTKTSQTLEALLDEVKQATFLLRDQLAPLPRPKPLQQSQPSPVVDSIPSAPQEKKSALIGTLKIDTEPSGADIYISRNKGQFGEYAGTAPVEKQLLPLNYWVTAKLENHRKARRRIQIDPGETENRKIKLERIYPWNPYKLYGNLAFWPGLTLSAFGVLALTRAQDAASNYRSSLSSEAKSESEAWAGVMWSSFAIGAALMTTGIVLWLLSPGDREYYEMTHGSSARLPRPPDILFAY